MAYTISTDISRMLLAGQKEIFLKNYDPFPIEYTMFTTPKTATKKTETYDSMGNLQAAAEKVEGDAINYGKVEQAYQTSITNKTWANGFSHSLEAIKYDLYGVVNSAKAKELARTMRELEETNGVAPWNNAFATALADGQPLCTNSRPLFNVGGTFNDTLTTGALTYDNIKTAVNMFAVFKNHQGGQMKSVPDRIFTHAVNMITVEEILMSQRKAYEFSNTENKLPTLRGVYSHYLTDTDAWFIEDSSYEHVLFQWFMKTEFDFDEDKRSTKNMYFNAIAMYQTGALPNIGVVGSAG
jgi:hypothetical protein